jgi:hypothetical protein
VPPPKDTALAWHPGPAAATPFENGLSAIGVPGHHGEQLDGRTVRAATAEDGERKLVDHGESSTAPKLSDCGTAVCPSKRARQMRLGVGTVIRAHQAEPATFQNPSGLNSLGGAGSKGSSRPPGQLPQPSGFGRSLMPEVRKICGTSTRSDRKYCGSCAPTFQSEQIRESCPIRRHGNSALRRSESTGVAISATPCGRDLHLGPLQPPGLADS